MLRGFLIAAAAALACTGIALLLKGACPAGWELVAIGLLLLAGTVFERWRYRRVASARPEAQWQRTPERFLDPSTGETVEVLFDPHTGERHYVRATPGDRPDPAP